MTDTGLALRQQNGLVVRDDAGSGLAMSFGQMRARVEALNDFFKGVMQEGTDYGVIPGTPKPSLYQPGAQLLDGVFGLAPTFEEMPTCVRDYERGFFSFDVRCKLVQKATGEIAAEAIGHCNSKEDRYRWRNAQRVCPTCGADAITKSKFDDGWFCFAKKGGCGAKFAGGDPAIEQQEAGRVENTDPYTLVNTIHKMAQKRAHVAATLNATGASRIFTQDVEDLPEFQRGAPASQSSAQSGGTVGAAQGNRPPTARPGNGRSQSEPQRPPHVDADGVIVHEDTSTDTQTARLAELKQQAATLYRMCTDAGLTVAGLPADQRTVAGYEAWLTTWSGKLTEHLEAQKAAEATENSHDAAANTDDPDDLPSAEEIWDSIPSASPTAPQQAPAPAQQPAWWDTPKGKVVSGLVDQLTEAGKRFTLPANDATEADLDGWIASKRGLLQQKGS